ncbi:hypothetical protein B0H15DRAFT_825648 [Mycena belliarum]|uniref:DUF6699 domain-containing protein n=1 Tax=Mycena belliarum TaxID=1033014 RepID=A0AAD6UAR9_9AGAR|nr:hypothetical protein B0H15DRAFT_825648 [Mycena belliae]
MRMNQRDAGGIWAHNAPPHNTIVAPPSGPCARSDASRLPPRIWSGASAVASLRLGQSTTPFLSVEDGPQDPRQSSVLPRLAEMPDAQPRRPSRPHLVALPPQIEGITDVTMHPALVRESVLRTIDFMSMPTPARYTSWRTLLSEPATCPGLPSLTILAPQLPWVITAHASNISLSVSVADILAAICDALRLCVDERQFEDWVMMTQDGHRPCPRRRRNTGIAYRPGMTRLDLFEGKTKFAGLRASAMGCDIWTLVVG